jgi:type I restriction enzyme, S subunit
VSMNNSTKFPRGWRIASLSDKDLIQIIMGQSPPGDTYNKAGIGLPFFQGSKDFGVVYPEVRIWCSHPNRIAEPNDILLSVRAPVGPTNLVKERCCIGRGIVALRCNAGLSFKYLLMALRHYEKEIVGAGSIFTAIGKDEIKSISFPLPPSVDDQNAIANKIESKFNQIEQMRTAAKRQLEAVFSLPFAELRSLFIEKKLPDGWKIAKLSELCIINPSKPKGFDRKADAPTTFIPMEAVDDKTGTVIAPRVRPYSSVARGYTYFEEGDVLFAKITPCMQNGKTAIVSGLKDRIGFGSTEFHVLRAKPGIDSRWIYYLLRSAEFRRKAEDNFEGSAGQRRVPDLFLKNVHTPFCGDGKAIDRLMAHIDKRMGKFHAMRNASTRQLEAISALPSATLREFFNFGNEVHA